MIVLMTDFGNDDPYVGQLKARLIEHAPSIPIVDLMHTVPDFNAHSGAHLLGALSEGFPPESLFLCVVDPGVGTARDAVVVKAGTQWFVGPDNGLLSVVAARRESSKVWRIQWRPSGCSPSFHGRDIFAPVAAMIASGAFPEDMLVEKAKLDVEFDAGDLNRVIYIDHYGNAWTGIRSGLVEKTSRLACKQHEFASAETFGHVDKGQSFWYANSAGLVEIAVNRGHAASQLGLKIGDPVQISTPAHYH